jgi:hypothetical protein
LGWSNRSATPERRLRWKGSDRWWFPEIALGVGIKQVAQGPFDDLVPLVSTAIALPLLDRQQPERSRADSRTTSVVRRRGLFAPGGKSGPERADHGANDRFIELATVHA